MKNISDTSKNDLIHYVSMRKCVLDIFSKSLELDAEGKYKSEGEVHDVIMRRRKDSDDLDYDDHNLRSEEHTSELQSLMRISYAVFCLKKKITKHCKIPKTDNIHNS